MFAKSLIVSLVRGRTVLCGGMADKARLENGNKARSQAPESQLFSLRPHWQTTEPDTVEREDYPRAKRAGRSVGTVGVLSSRNRYGRVVRQTAAVDTSLTTSVAAPVGATFPTDHPCWMSNPELAAMRPTAGRTRPAGRTPVSTRGRDS